MAGSVAFQHANRFMLSTKLLSNNSPIESDRKNNSLFADSLCTVVASSDGRIPLSKSVLPANIYERPFLWKKFDLIYHTLEREEIKSLKNVSDVETGRTNISFDRESKLVSTMKKKLQNAGFKRLNQRDLDLCAALNEGYLLRLSILPDISALDPSLSEDFYPELFTDNQTETTLPFGGRVIIYHRGYSSEVTKGRLLLPKLDYLQTSMVQRSIFPVNQRLAKMERFLYQSGSRLLRRQSVFTKNVLYNIASSLPTMKLKSFARERLGWKRVTLSELRNEIRLTKSKDNIFFKLVRYGTSASDSLTSFLIYEPRTMHDNRTVSYKNFDGFMCEYDSNLSLEQHENMFFKLLERVSISNLVDIFSTSGRRQFVKKFFSPVELVEPTFEEVVVIWRFLPKKRRKKFQLPRAVYEVAEIFGFEDKMPPKRSPESPQSSPLLEIRAFDSVPMANLPAVLPKTRLIFRPADALLFDLVSVFTLAFVLLGTRFDSPYLDFLALISVSLWIFRTVTRYANKLSRYDLLVKNFLTSKIARRDFGAIEYISNEAASQQAIRAALLHRWLSTQHSLPLHRDDITKAGILGINQMLNIEHVIEVDVAAGLNDLENLGLVSFSINGEQLLNVASEEEALKILRSAWLKAFDGKLNFAMQLDLAP